MAKFTITKTTNKWFRVESRFQRIGTYKTEKAAHAAIKKEQERLEFFYTATNDAPQTYIGIMTASIEAERKWNES